MAPGAADGVARTGGSEARVSAAPAASGRAGGAGESESEGEGVALGGSTNAGPSAPARSERSAPAEGWRSPGSFAHARATAATSPG